MIKYLLGVLGLFPILLSAQTLKGRVLDEQAQPIKGAAIFWQGTTSGVESDESGRFELTFPIDLKAKIIVVSSLGYERKTIELGNQTELEITLPSAEFNLEAYTIRELSQQRIAIERLPEVYGTYITSGKKNEVIQIAEMDLNLADKTGRQLFAKVPGAFVYDMDGAGNQLNIATRGLDPHRSWEYNVRLNGVMTNSDLYGYPASHFSAPMESIERVELIRGTASLQYGATYGGMVNYVTKAVDTTRKIAYEGNFNYGSFNTRSMYHAIGGRLGRLTYQAYAHNRAADGYRDNAESTSNAQFLSLAYALSPSMTIKSEIAHSTYRYRLPGPLSDAQFYDNPRQATRSRNFYSPDIWVPSLQFDWKINPRTHFNVIANGLYGTRNSVLFLGFADRQDLPNSQGQFSNRQVDIDRFNSFTAEARLKHQFATGAIQHTTIAGLRYINNDLNRQQIGQGTNGFDYDLSLVRPGFGRDLWYQTNNLALFAEHLLQLTPRWSFSGGFRVEQGETDMSGTISYLRPEKVPNQIIHRFPLFGASLQYKLNTAANLYAGISEAYRPVLFADVIPANALEKVDSNLLNSRGFNAELGIRGQWRNWIHFDVSVFAMHYNNRIGSTIIQENGQPLVFKTNLGNSITHGLELYTEVKVLESKHTRLSVFTSTSYFDARYVQGTLVSGGKVTEISGNRIESTPRWMTRNGIQARVRSWSASLQYSWVDFTYSDPENTVTPTANGSRGIVPAYGLFDFNTTYRFNRHVSLRASVSNLTDTQYFTKRPTIYPGPGVWPSDGRSVTFTLMLKL